MLWRRYRNCFLVRNSGLINVNDIKYLSETKDKRILTATGTAKQGIVRVKSD